jgi:hypothetical protein
MSDPAEHPLDVYVSKPRLSHEMRDEGEYERRLHEGLCHLCHGDRVSYSSQRKFMYVTPCYMPCMRNVSPPQGVVRGTRGADIRFSANELPRIYLRRGWVNRGIYAPFDSLKSSRIHRWYYNANLESV